jgi:hypothetical protein
LLCVLQGAFDRLFQADRLLARVVLELIKVPMP